MKMCIGRSAIIKEDYNTSNIKINTDNKPKLNIIFIGDNDVGKTSIFTQYSENTFNENKSTKSTGVAFVDKVLKTENKSTEIRLWDVYTILLY